MSATYRPVRHRYEDALTRLSWRDMRQRIASHFEGLGYAVECAPGEEHAGHGIDMVLRRGDETLVASCKHWTAFQVPHDDVHRLIGQMPAVDATSALLMTSGEFTRTAIDAAARFRHVRLIDGRALRAMLGPLDEALAGAPAAPGAPAWTPIVSAPPAVRPSSGRAAATAAVAAVLVMAVAMVTLYSWYLQGIHARQSEVVRVQEIYRHDGVAPAPPPFAPPPPVPGTSGDH